MLSEEKFKNIARLPLKSMFQFSRTKTGALRNNLAIPEGLTMGIEPRRIASHVRWQSSPLPGGERVNFEFIIDSKYFLLLSPFLLGESMMPLKLTSACLRNGLVRGSKATNKKFGLWSCCWRILYRVWLKGGSQLREWCMQARQGRSGKLEQEQNSPNLRTAF